MSTRFYHGQLDYVDQLNNMDDVATASATSAAASAAAAAQSAEDAATAAETLTVPLGNIMYLTAQYTVATGAFVAITLPTTGTTLQNGYSYRVELNLVGTGLNAGSVFLAHLTAVGVWSVTAVSTLNATIYQPQARISLDGTKLEIFHNYTSTLTIRAAIKSIHGNTNVLPTTTYGLEGFYSIISGIPTVTALDVGKPIAGTGNQGLIRYYKDTGAAAWAHGVDGAAGGVNWILYDVASSGIRLRVQPDGTLTSYISGTGRLTVNSSGILVVGTITGTLSGNASSATVLATPRNINGVAFDGSADITVADSTKLPLSGGSLSGDLTFTGTVRRILGDFSNSTIANRAMFRTTTTNGITTVGVIPNGSSTTAYYSAFDNSTPTNAAVLNVGVDNTTTFVSSQVTGTGTLKSLKFLIGSNTAINITTANDIGLFGGTPTAVGATYRTLALGAGTTGSILEFRTAADAKRATVTSNTSGALVLSNETSTLPLLFYTAGAERLKIDNAGLLTISGSMTFAGTGNRISADFSNSTHANRLLFQTSTTNSTSTLGVIPNGTGIGTALNLYAVVDSANSAVLQLGSNNTTAFVSAVPTGTGATVPLAFNVAGNERFRLSATANRIQGNFSTGTTSTLLMFQDVTAGNITSVGALANNSTGVGQAQFAAYNNGLDVNNCSFTRFGANATVSYLIADKTGTGTYLPLTFTTSGIERARIDTGGNLLFATTNSGDPLTVRVNGIVFNAGNTAMYSRGGAHEMGTTGTNGTHIFFYTDNGSAAVSAGNIGSNGNTTTYNTGSDYRLKTNIRPMENALASIKQIKFCEWEWLENGTTGEGVLAHELAGINKPVPHAVWGSKDEVDGNGNPRYQSADYSKLVPRLGGSIQELSNMLEQALLTIANLQQRITILEGN